MSARRPSFRVIEGGGDPVARPPLHRVPLVPRDDNPPPCIGCWIVAGAVVWGIIGLAAWIATCTRWGRL